MHRPSLLHLVAAVLLAAAAVCGAQPVIDLASLPPGAGSRFDAADAGTDTGSAVSRIGDMDGDGRAEIAIGAPKVGNGLPPGGTVFVLFGRPGGFPAQAALGSLDGTSGFRIAGVPLAAGAWSGLGARIASAGDVNGDGLADLLAVGFQQRDAVVVFGRRTPFPAVVAAADLDGADGFRIGGPPDFGVPFGIAGGFDLNRDGIDDLAVGYSNATVDGRLRAGRVVVLFGRRSGFPARVDGLAFAAGEGFRIDGTQAEQVLGDSMASAGDIDGDGFADLLLTASLTTANGRVAAYVIHARPSAFPPLLDLGSLDGTTGFALVLPANAPASLQIAAGIGDVNADGLDDVAIGRSNDPANPQDFHGRGTTFVVFGHHGPRAAELRSADFDGLVGARIVGAHPSGQAGTGLAGVGDFTGDGIADLAIGVQRDSDLANRGATIRLVHGRAGRWPTVLGLGMPGDDSVTTIIDRDAAANTGTPFGLSGAGDADGDGVADLLAGDLGTPRNRAHLIRGRSAVLFRDDFE